MYFTPRSISAPREQQLRAYEPGMCTIGPYMSRMYSGSSEMSVTSGRTPHAVRHLVLGDLRQHFGITGVLILVPARLHG